MQNVGAMIDDYILESVEEPEAKVVHQCEQCSCPLYEGEEVAEDGDGNYFCDEYCAKEFHGITESIL